MRSFYLPLAAGHQAHVCRVVDALEVGRLNHYPYTGSANEVEYNLNSNLLADSFSNKYQPAILFIFSANVAFYFRSLPHNV